jgi:hypothetical protein
MAILESNSVAGAVGRAAPKGGAVLPLGGLYQLGFITHDLEAAMAQLGTRYGVSRYRRRSTPMMESAHAYAGESMIELILPGPEAPPLYTDFVLEPGTVARLHHLGRLVPDAAAWARLEAAISASGLATPMMGEVMGGDLKYAYVDTRADLGIYSEYVCLIGEARKMYDDVPRN